MTGELYAKLTRGTPVARPTPEISERLAFLDMLPSKSWNLRGVDTQCYTIGSLAKVLDKQPVTIRSWEQKGWLKPPHARSHAPKSRVDDQEMKIGDTVIKGRRLYTRQQVEFLINAYEESKLDDPKKADWSKFRSLLQSYPQP